MSQVRTAVRGQVRSAIRGNVGNPVGFSAPFYDGIHLDFRTGRHYVKVPGGAATVGAFSSLFTFTGDNQSYYRAASGLYVASATNTPRIEYDANGNVLGLLMEGSRINQLLQSRDQTNAAWVKTTMTAAKDQVGEDGVSNSASSLLATGAAATSLQTIVQAAVNSTFSISIKRLIGTGTIGICQDGATFTDVTAQINSSTYTRVTLTASQLNPVLGIRLGTSGDKIAVDFAGFEAGAFASSRIPTTTVAVTRAAEAAQRVVGAEYVQTAGTVFAEMDVVGRATVAEALFFGASDNTNANIIWLDADNTALSPQTRIDVASVNQVNLNSMQTLTVGVMFKYATAFTANDSAAKSSTSASLQTTASGSMPGAITRINLGSAHAAQFPQNGHIRRLDYYPTRLANNVLQQLTA